MKLIEIMTKNPAVCEPRTPLSEVAKMMCEHDCGEIPVVADRRSLKPVGVVTDRDIACRVVAEGKNPLELAAGDCMSRPCVTVRLDADVEECARTLEQKKIRRVPVVDREGRCVGIVAQADLALRADSGTAGEVVREVSRA